MKIDIDKEVIMPWVFLIGVLLICFFVGSTYSKHYKAKSDEARRQKIAQIENAREMEKSRLMKLPKEERELEIKLKEIEMLKKQNDEMKKALEDIRNQIFYLRRGLL